MEKISEFKGEFAFLSNFFPITLEGLTAEHLFQAAKPKNIGDKFTILFASSPGKAKRLGRKCELRSDWEDIKVREMKSVLIYKFSFPFFREKLLSTGNSLLEEGNNWDDTFWGICPPNSGSGENMLGKLLMEIRQEIRDGKHPCVNEQSA